MFICGDDADVTAEIPSNLTRSGWETMVNDRAGRTPSAMERVKRLVDEALRNGVFSSEADLQSAVSRVMHDYNRRPQVELGGLSPDAVFRLFSADWTAASAIVIDESTPLGELGGAPLLHHARALLALLADGVKATATGSLPRATVAAFLDEAAARGGDEELAELWAMGFSMRNELDVWPLHHTRVLLEVAGLVARRKGIMRVTRQGASLAGEGKAGALWARLVRAQCKRMNLDYLDAMDPAPALQYAIGFALFQFSRGGDRWIASEEWATRLLPADVWAALPIHPQFDHRTLMVERRVLYVLWRFGLAEREERPAPAGRYGNDRVYRPSPLLAARVRFRLEDGA